MKRIFVAGAFFFAFAPTAQAAEEEIKQCFCQGMEQDVALQGGEQADCVNATHAIKIDSTENWAGALGQVLHYATQTDKSAKIILYCRQGSSNRSCQNQTRRLENTVANFSLPIVIEKFSENEVIAKCGRDANREEREIGAARLIPIW